MLSPVSISGYKDSGKARSIKPRARPFRPEDSMLWSSLARVVLFRIPTVHARQWRLRVERLRRRKPGLTGNMPKVATARRPAVISDVYRPVSRAHQRLVSASAFPIDSSHLQLLPHFWMIVKDRETRLWDDPDPSARQRDLCRCALSVRRQVLLERVIDHALDGRRKRH